MSIKFKYGKGKGHSYTSIFSFGGLVVELKQSDKNKTFKQIADALARKFKIKNGQIELDNIAFVNYKGND